MHVDNLNCKLGIGFNRSLGGKTAQQVRIEYFAKYPEIRLIAQQALDGIRAQYRIETAWLEFGVDPEAGEDHLIAAFLGEDSTADEVVECSLKFVPIIAAAEDSVAQWVEWNFAFAEWYVEQPFGCSCQLPMWQGAFMARLSECTEN